MKISVVIPSFNEPTLLQTLASLNEAKGFDEVEGQVYVVLNDAVNSPTSVKSLHRDQYNVLRNWKGSLDIRPIYKGDIPSKKAGVGWARKIGMDTAVSERGAGRDHIIVNLDGDCTVPENYWTGWARAFSDETVDAVSMYFEHPLEGMDLFQRKAIAEYELHLRYYYRLQVASGYPLAMQAIGSAMGVRADFYRKIGGMNRRKAGEDFYFLQKCGQNGILSHAANTCIYPSARYSDRVPFGTGKAMLDRREKSSQPTYKMETMVFLESVNRAFRSYAQDPQLDIWEALPVETIPYFEGEGLGKELRDAVQHTKGTTALERRLFRWFHNFRLMKLVHYLRDHHLGVGEVNTEAGRWMGMDGEVETLLSEYRALDRRDWGGNL